MRFLRWLLDRLLFWRRRRVVVPTRAERRRLRARQARFNKKLHARLLRSRSHGGPSHTKAVHNDRKRAKI